MWPVAQRSPSISPQLCRESGNARSACRFMGIALLVFDGPCQPLPTGCVDKWIWRGLRMRATVPITPPTLYPRWRLPGARQNNS